MIAWKDDFCWNARPHPGPLPRGEGGSFAISPEIVGLRLLKAHPKREVARRLFSLPGGLGQGEGERHTIVASSF